MRLVRDSGLRVRLHGHASGYVRKGTGAFSTSRTLYRKAKNGTYRETRDRIDRRDRQKVTTDK